MWHVCPCCRPIWAAAEGVGDLVLVASAGFWSLVMVRQSRHAPDYPSFPLGTYKVSAFVARGIVRFIYSLYS